jgi:uncharacterized protein DUF6496
MKARRPLPEATREEDAESATAGLGPLDRDRAASLADEGGASAAALEGRATTLPRTPAEGEGGDMPRAKTSRGRKRRYGATASTKVGKAMHEMKRGRLRSGRSGKRVTSRKQAIAIGLSQARRSGARVPRRRAP